MSNMTCRLCGEPIIGKWREYDGPAHMTEESCVLACRRSITALRAEVGRRTEEARDARHDKMVAQNERDDCMADLHTRDEELATLRSQLSARDAKVRALRGFAQATYEEGRIDGWSNNTGWLLDAMKERGLLDESYNPTPLLTGEPGPGGEK